jgi:small subunit ribosomal protein S15
MVMTPARRTELVSSYRTNPKDSGSTEVQVALLTERIVSMTGHLKTHPKDNHSRLGLTKMVARRNRLLTYLRDRDVERYKTLIERLGLRK